MTSDPTARRHRKLRLAAWLLIGQGGLMEAGVFGALRIVGAVGLLRNRMWGLALSLVSAVTLALMIFLLPAGITDGLLSGTALVLILPAWLGATRVIAPTEAEAERRPSLISQ